MSNFVTPGDRWMYEYQEDRDFQKPIFIKQGYDEYGKVFHSYSARIDSPLIGSPFPRVAGEIAQQNAGKLRNLPYSISSIEIDYESPFAGESSLFTYGNNGPRLLANARDNVIHPPHRP